MGLCGSKEKVYTELRRDSKKKKERFLASTGSLSGTFVKLKISKGEVKKWFDTFDRFDANHSGNLTLDEFFDHLPHVEYTKFAARCFDLFDQDHDKLDTSRNHRTTHPTLLFEEFFCGVSTLCTMSREDLAKFVYEIGDRDGDRHLTFKELEDILVMTAGSKGLDARARHVLQSMDKDGDHEVSMEEWVAVSKANASLLFPIYTVQQEMRKEIMGTSYWKKQEQVRKKLRVSNQGWKRMMTMHNNRPPPSAE